MEKKNSLRLEDIIAKLPRGKPSDYVGAYRERYTTSKTGRHLIVTRLQPQGALKAVAKTFGAREQARAAKAMA